MTEKNIFLCFQSLVIFYVKTATPEKSHPPPSKNWDTVKPPFLKIWSETQPPPPPQQKGMGGVHTMQT